MLCITYCEFYLYSYKILAALLAIFLKTLIKSALNIFLVVYNTDLTSYLHKTNL